MDHSDNSSLAEKKLFITSAFIKKNSSNKMKQNTFAVRQLFDYMPDTSPNFWANSKHVINLYILNTSEGGRAGEEV